MLRIYQCDNADNAKSYYTSGFAREDYYTEEHEIIGLWGGIGAIHLGLHGEVTRDEFFALADNLRPDEPGTPLTPRTKDNRTVGYDFSFSVPKAVSVVHAITKDERIADAFKQSVRETMQLIERSAATRVRLDGENFDRTTGNLVWADFIHLTTRPVEGTPDPQLHAHVFVFNATFDPEEERWKAAQFKQLKRDAPFYEAVYRSRFAHKLSAMGFPIKRLGRDWTFAGIPWRVTEEFSRRLQDIEDYIEAYGITSDRLKAEIGARTRDNKASNYTRDQLRQLWANRLRPGERDAIEQVRDYTVSLPRELSAAEALAFATGHLFTKLSVVTFNKLKEEALRAGFGSVTLEQIEAEIIADQNFVVRNIDGIDHCTTREVHAEEQRMMRLARDSRGSCRALGTEESLTDLPDYLTDDQSSGIRHLLRSKDRVSSVHGGPGTGKTSAFRVAVEHAEKAGKVLYAFAPTAAASRTNLREAGFVEAETVYQLLEGQPEKYKKLIKDQIIWIDEAGMLGTKDMADIFDLAIRCNCRVWLSGDPRQLKPIQRGDALRLLEKFNIVKPHYLEEIVRQTGEFKTVCELIRDERIEEAFDKLEKMRDLEVLEGEPLLRKLADDYLSARRQGHTALVLTPTHAEAARVTEMIRSGLRTDKKLGTMELPFTKLKSLNLELVQRQEASTYRIGMVLQFHQHAPGIKSGSRLEIIEDLVRGDGVKARDQHGRIVDVPFELADRFKVFEQDQIFLAKDDHIRITNRGMTEDAKRLQAGGAYTVKGFTAHGDIVLNNGWIVGKGFWHISHDYVRTIHSSQSLTVGRAFLSLPAAVLRVLKNDQLLVSITRGKWQAKVYTDDKEMLYQEAQKMSERMSASELLDHRPPRTPRSRFTTPSPIEIARFKMHEQKTKDASREPVIERDREIDDVVERAKGWGMER